MSALAFRCTCKAVFASIDELDLHLQAEQTRKIQDRDFTTRIVQRFEQYLSHAKAEDEDTTSDDDIATVDVLQKHQDEHGYHCPYEGCDQGPVKKLAVFREHYGIHINYERTCPICWPFKSQTSIEWIRHAKRHQNLEDDVDKKYLQDKCADLHQRIRKELIEAHPKPCLSRTRKTQKRKLGEISTESAGPRVQWPRLENVDNIANARLSTQSTTSAESAEYFSAIPGMAGNTSSRTTQHLVKETQSDGISSSRNQNPLSTVSDSDMRSSFENHMPGGSRLGLFADGQDTLNSPSIVSFALPPQREFASAPPIYQVKNYPPPLPPPFST
ncbi:putative C2H2-type domain-containing protein [Seiridium cardinale]